MGDRSEAFVPAWAFLSTDSDRGSYKPLNFAWVANVPITDPDSEPFSNAYVGLLSLITTTDEEGRPSTNPLGPVVLTEGTAFVLVTSRRVLAVLTEGKWLGGNFASNRTMLVSLQLESIVSIEISAKRSMFGNTKFGSTTMWGAGASFCRFAFRPMGGLNNPWQPEARTAQAGDVERFFFNDVATVLGGSLERDQLSLSLHPEPSTMAQFRDATAV